MNNRRNTLVNGTAGREVQAKILRKIGNWLEEEVEKNIPGRGCKDQKLEKMSLLPGMV